MTEALFTPLKVGGIEAANRIVMAPLTRSRANDDSGEVGDMHVEYYAQRAGAGIIITEASCYNFSSPDSFLAISKRFNKHCLDYAL